MGKEKKKKKQKLLDSLRNTGMCGHLRTGEMQIQPNFPDGTDRPQILPSPQRKSKRKEVQGAIEARK